MVLIIVAQRTMLNCSSAKDELTGQPVAIKKILKPFSTPVLAKRTYRELKLLKHLRHENVLIIYFARAYR
jgi:serine/threonine protein kinase